MDAEKLINDFYYDKFYPNIRFPVDINQIMYQLQQTFKVYVLKANSSFPVETGCDFTAPSTCVNEGNECCAQIVMKDTFTEVLQTKELCLNMAFETDLEPLTIGDFSYKIKCGGFDTSEWKSFSSKSGAIGFISVLGLFLTAASII